MKGVELLLDEIFHSLDVVIGHRLYLLHAGSLLHGELAVDAANHLLVDFAERRQLRQPEFGEGYEVLNFDTHTVFYQRIFREKLVETLTLRAVAAIDRANCRQAGKFHYQFRFKLKIKVQR